MSRIPRLQRQALNEQQRELYEQITGGPRAAGPQLFALTDRDGGLRGPFNALLLSPEVGGALQAVGIALRYRSTLSARLRELAILAVAAHWDSAFEWHAHERIARSVGIAQPELDAVRIGDAASLPPIDAIALRLVREMMSGDVGDDEYAEAVAVLGEKVIFELSTIVGYYGTLALQLKLFRVSV